MVGLILGWEIYMKKYLAITAILVTFSASNSFGFGVEKPVDKETIFKDVKPELLIRNVEPELEISNFDQGLVNPKHKPLSPKLEEVMKKISVFILESKKCSMNGGTPIFTDGQKSDRSTGSITCKKGSGTKLFTDSPSFDKNQATKEFVKSLTSEEKVDLFYGLSRSEASNNLDIRMYGIQELAKLCRDVTELNGTDGVYNCTTNTYQKGATAKSDLDQKVQLHGGATNWSAAPAPEADFAATSAAQ
jgi:hypothetical protein